MRKFRHRRYRLIEEIGRGGMSTVYRAEDRKEGREVALKLIHAQLTEDAETHERFAREFEAFDRLNHPNIVEIFDCSSSRSKSLFIITELVDGPTLRGFVTTTDLSCPELGVALAHEICHALEHTHGLGVIHRDVKPENILIDGVNARVKLTDFGVSRALDAETLTATGHLLGSPAHMSPEMIAGNTVGFQSDIFSFGTVLYFLVTNGELPFEGRTTSEILRNIFRARFTNPAVKNPRIGRRLSRVVGRCLAHAPDDRYPSFTALKAALAETLAALPLPTPGEISRRLILEPEGYPEVFEAMLVEQLLERSREATREGDIAIASDLLNRLLVYRPDHVEGTALLEKLFD